MEKGSCEECCRVTVFVQALFEMVLVLQKICGRWKIEAAGLFSTDHSLQLSHLVHHHHCRTHLKKWISAGLMTRLPWSAEASPLVGSVLTSRITELALGFVRPPLAGVFRQLRKQQLPHFSRIPRLRWSRLFDLGSR